MIAVCYLHPVPLDRIVLPPRVKCHVQKLATEPSARVTKRRILRAARPVRNSRDLMAERPWSWPCRGTGHQAGAEVTSAGMPSMLPGTAPNQAFGRDRA